MSESTKLPWFKTLPLDEDIWKNTFTGIDRNSLPANVEFLYNLGGEFGCEKLAKDYFAIKGSEHEIHNSCLQLTSDLVLTRLMVDGENPVQLNSDQLETLCADPKATEDRIYLSITDFDKNETTVRNGQKIEVTKTQLNELVPGVFYCIIGHGDHPGGDEVNRKLGWRRADLLKSKIDASDPKLIAVSLGRFGTQRADSGESRRVDVKRLKFQLIEIK